MNKDMTTCKCGVVLDRTVLEKEILKFRINLSEYISFYGMICPVCKSLLIKDTDEFYAYREDKEAEIAEKFQRTKETWGYYGCQ